MKLLIATGNKHKAEEFRRILSPLGFKVETMADLNIKEQPAETGKTFSENAYIKAKFLQGKTGLPVIADDSGLEVKALGGRPGIYSARYAGEGATSRQCIEKLLKELDGETDRAAEFVCVICYLDSDGEPSFVEGRCQGVIGENPAGDFGFGYDPVFFVGDNSFAEIPPHEKDKISHRAKALKNLLDLLKLKGRD